MEKRFSTALVISSTWPVPDSGAGIATVSALQQYAKVFARISFVGLVDRPFVHRGIWDAQVFDFIRIPIKRFPKGIRFALTATSSLPAISHQYMNSAIQRKVVDIAAAELERASQTVLIFEDIPIPIAMLPSIRNRFPALPVAIRSENVASRVFSLLQDTGTFLSRLAWRIEVTKIRRHEIKICQLANQLWAISTSDLQEYERRLGIHCDGVFGVSIDIGRYATVPEGDIKTVISIGTVDLRKSLGLQRFIVESWPRILSRYPTARLLLGGLNSERLTDPQQNISGIGRVEDDRDILGQGLIMVNTQEIGAGINLKSIVAMASGKALVSTQKGVEGIEGVNGKHFLAGPDAGSLAPLILELMDDPIRARQIGQEARKFVASMYSEARLEAQVRPLLERLVAMI